MQLHSIFPVSIYDCDYSNADNFNQFAKMNLLRFIDTNGKTHDGTTGTLHLELVFEDFFSFIGNSFYAYMKSLSVDTNEINAYITKSWFESRRGVGIVHHAHRNSHYSFVYYVNNPDDCRRDISFSCGNSHPSEGNPGFFSAHTITDSTWVSAKTWVFPSDVGKLYIWPSHLLHTTVGDDKIQENTGAFTIDDVEQQRIAIAGDIMVSSLPSGLHDESMTDPSLWRKFDE